MLKVLIVLMLLLMLPIAIANIDYNETGNFDSDYNQGNILFDQGIELTGIKGLSDGKNAPLVSDVNNDNVQEIIVLAGDQILFFSGSSLTAINAHTLTANERYSNMIVFDIQEDGDGLTEVIIALEESELIEIVRLNGSSTSSTTIDISSLDNTLNGEMLIKCFDQNKCMLSFINDLGASVNTRNRVVTFNSTNIGTQSSSLVTLDAGGSSLCNSNIRSGEMLNIDSDENIEFVYSLIESQTSDDEAMHIVIVELNNSDNWVSDTPILQKVITEDALVGELGGTCVTNIGRFISNAAVADFDGFPNELEVVLAWQQELNDEMRMRLSQIDGDSLTLVPAAFPAASELVSNIIVGDFFTQIDIPEFCILGFSTDDQNMNLLCAGFGLDLNTLPLLTIDNAQFDIILDQNITVTKTRWDSLIHAVNLVGSDEQDEIVTALGIFDLDFSSIDCREGILSVGDCALSENLPFTASTTIVPVDPTKTGRNDLLSLQANSIQYLNDKFENSDAFINTIFTDPCILGVDGSAGSTAKQNTTLEVTVTASDVDGDDISTQVTIYQGTADEQVSEFQANQSSGTPQLHPFILNATGTAIMLIEVKDDVDQDVTTETRTFSVGSNGVEFNSCTSLITIVVLGEVPAVNVSLTDDGFIIEGAAEASTIRDATNALSIITGLGGATLWLILMFIVAILLITGSASLSVATLGKIDSNAMMAGVVGALLADGVIFTVAAINGVFSAGIIFMVVLLFVVVIVALGSRFVFSSQMATGGR